MCTNLLHGWGKTVQNHFFFNLKITNFRIGKSGLKNLIDQLKGEFEDCTKEKNCVALGSNKKKTAANSLARSFLKLNLLIALIFQ